MKYISIDIETTGLDPEKHQILEFAAVLEDTENQAPLLQLPTFHRLIRWEDITVSNYWRRMHYQLFIDIDKGAGICTTIGQLSGHFCAWLNSNKVPLNYNVAGANFAGFDAQFLKKVPDFPPWFYRVIEVGSMYFDSKLGQLPSLSEIVGVAVTHRALEDALDVVKAIRRYYDTENQTRHTGLGSSIHDRSTCGS